MTATDGIYFDAGAVALDLAFIESLTLTKSTKSGKPEPFRVLPHYRKLIANVMGWRKPDGYRLFRTAFWSMARKNIKTQGAAGIGLRELVIGEESSPEVYVAAKDKDQASICFDAAARMVLAHEELADVLRVVPHLKTIHNPMNGGIFRALSSDGKGKHGYNPSCVIFDEFHVWDAPEEELHAALTTGSAARKQPLFLYITTAGVDENTMCGREYKRAKRILSGIEKNATYFADIYEVPMDAAWDDESLWHLANPTIGEVVTLDALRVACDAAKDDPVKLTDFRRLSLNQWVNAASTWIQRTQWDACSWNGSSPIPVTADSTSPQ